MDNVFKIDTSLFYFIAHLERGLLTYDVQYLKGDNNKIKYY